MYETFEKVEGKTEALHCTVYYTYMHMLVMYMHRWSFTCMHVPFLYIQCNPEELHNSISPAQIDVLVASLNQEAQ